MVLKRKNKISKRLKKGMRGGFFGFEFDNSVAKLVSEWTSFITALSTYYFNLQKPDCTENCEEFISKDEFDNSLSLFLAKIEIIKAGKENAFKAKASCSIKREEKQNNNKNIIIDFDREFLIILNKVKSNIKNTDIASDNYKTMMSLVSKLPKIEDSLNKLTAENIKDLDGRYKVILEILGSVCSGFTAPFCSGAAKMLGKEVSTLYSELKENSNKKDTISICEMILISFIKDVLPIMITKLKNINEFTAARKNLIKINNNEELGLTRVEEAEVGAEVAPATGGKKSSRATHKEILGKQMKIYRKPNDKKEYVKHKGVLISTKEYKEHMKQGAAITKKVILGKERCIYKVRGSKQDHVKYKGSLIPVADYKKLMKA